MTIPPPPPPPPPPPRFIFPPSTTQFHPTTTGSTLTRANNAHQTLKVPTAPPNPNSILVSLLIHNGWPFADHWEYLVTCPTNPAIGVVIQAAGDVRAGFWLEVKRGLVATLERRGAAGGGNGRRVVLGWVDGGLFASGGLGEVFPLAWAGGVGVGVGDYGREGGSGGGGGAGPGAGDESLVVEGVPRCEFERVLFKVPAPEKTLRAVGVDGEGGEVDRRTRITQRNCQTWVVESAEQLVREGIFEQRVVDYLRATSIMANC